MKNHSESPRGTEGSIGGLEARCFCLLLVGGAIRERDRVMERWKGIREFRKKTKVER